MINAFEFSSYRDLLKAALAQRMGANPSYSLRAFSRDCGVGASTLSGAITGASNISLKLATQIAARIGLSDSQKDYFVDLVRVDSQKDLALRTDLLARIRKLYPQSADIKITDIEIFKLISEWYHSPLLELPLIKHFRLTPESAAKALGVSRLTAEIAIDRLISLGLLKEGPGGEIKRSESQIRLRPESKTQALTKFYQQMLTKTAEAIETQGPERRVSGFLTIPFNTAKIDKVKIAYEKFLDELQSISEQDSIDTANRNDKIYHFAAHFFELANLEENRRKYEFTY